MEDSLLKEKENMVILIDSREKAGYRFDKYPVEIRSLPVGDYSIKGKAKGL